MLFHILYNIITPTKLAHQFSTLMEHTSASYGSGGSVATASWLRRYAMLVRLIVGKHEVQRQGAIQWYAPTKFRQNRSVNWFIPIDSMVISSAGFAVTTEVRPETSSETANYEEWTSLDWDRTQYVCRGNCCPR